MFITNEYVGDRSRMEDWRSMYLDITKHFSGTFQGMTNDFQLEATTL